MALVLALGVSVWLCASCECPWNKDNPVQPGPQLLPTVTSISEAVKKHSRRWRSTALGEVWAFSVGTEDAVMNAARISARCQPYK
ncbi:hypothetical protein B0H16DRAFT_1587173 [Mycena metata]|uniref:Uncharacterized protein n=1 Tax=Mycena metata TaxID=1033252 RepID=A0AAD7HX78_9AGAR|nr:hypothetical protein B0H16DRAFT_1587173 [Mycena metata]